MRGFFSKRAAAVSMALVIALLTPGAYAEDDPSPFDPPEARIRPPTGSTAGTSVATPSDGTANGQAKSSARIRPPTGKPGGDEPETRGESIFELFLGWLRLDLPVVIR